MRFEPDKIVAKLQEGEEDVPVKMRNLKLNDVFSTEDGRYLATTEEALWSDCHVGERVCAFGQWQLVAASIAKFLLSLQDPNDPFSDPNENNQAPGLVDRDLRFARLCFTCLA